MQPNTLPDAQLLLERLTANTRVRLARRTGDAPLVIGVQTGGLWIAQALAMNLGITSPIGKLDIGFYRDDFARSGLATALSPTTLPWPIEGRHILLVDDVLFTGRTIRAAINEIFDYGRPASITLAVLVARDGRELPIEADAVGAEIALAAGSSLKLRGPAPLCLELIETKRVKQVAHA
jgi:pyrimidine operon attenuation protein / uracil phosphoribosyltransferase